MNEITRDEKFTDQRFGGVRQVAPTIDEKILEIHGAYDKWHTSLCRVPGKILMTTGASTGSIFSIKQLVFKDGIRVFHHEGNLIKIGSPGLHFPNGTYSPKPPQQPVYPDEGNTPSGDIDNYPNNSEPTAPLMKIGVEVAMPISQFSEVEALSSTMAINLLGTDGEHTVVIEWPDDWFQIGAII